MTRHLSTLQPDGRFTLTEADGISHLYLPLFNESGMMSAITPRLGGDLKVDQNRFAIAPATQETMNDPENCRNVFLLVDGELYNATGNTPRQRLHPDKVELEVGLLYQSVTRSNASFSVSVVSFVPSVAEAVELHRIHFTNVSGRTLSVRPVLAFPLYGRSADNIRDHRHVTTLLNRVHVLRGGVVNEPTLSFDERGHLENRTAYGVFAVSDRHPEIADRWPILEEFAGEGGDLFYPAVPRGDARSPHRPGTVAEGYEALGGLGFSTVSLAPGESFSIVAGYVVADGVDAVVEIAARRMTLSAFDSLLQATKDHWTRATASVAMNLSSPERSGWLRWVGLQPVMRRIYGCSFLPHHDYGRGGRGWRDLWQDSLALTLLDPASARAGIVNNIRGVRIDGTNATIVGTEPGTFVADRNNIVRVWSDHGAWPFLTIDFYVQRTGDVAVLFEKTPYWKDKFGCYTKAIDGRFVQNGSNLLTDAAGKVYEGTILEHLILENVVPFFNVGGHGCVRLEGADWNDGIDMAQDNGETVAFTAMYAGNLARLADLLDHLRRTRNLLYVELPKEAAKLFGKLEKPLVGTPADLHAVRDDYFASVLGTPSGEIVRLNVIDLIGDLKGKARHWRRILNEQEWIDAGDGEGWYNGYYDDHGRAVDHHGPDGDRMTLTGQVFPLLAGLVPAERVPAIVRAVNRLLKDPGNGLIRLNTDFSHSGLRLGRFAGFAYGHKENGAFFSHMDVMYAYGLFAAGFPTEGNAVLSAQYAYMADVDRARILPGIPEYVDARGRGVYHYLTGSAAWTVIAYIERIFGIRGVYGDIAIEPRLEASHFDGGEASCAFIAGGRLCRLVVRNPEQRELGRYVVRTVEIDGRIQEIGASSFTVARKDCERGVTITATLGKAA
ncbi:MAG: hypothetical protein WC509_07405 [Candidatus Izemoplasmatales bacterium]